jgi:hypothetical protein
VGAEALLLPVDGDVRQELARTPLPHTCPATPIIILITSFVKDSYRIITYLR